MTLLAWGDNSHGQLGTGVTEEIQVTDPETGLTETVTVNVNASGTPVNGAGTANQNGSRYMEIAWSIWVATIWLSVLTMVMFTLQAATPWVSWVTIPDGTVTSLSE